MRLAFTMLCCVFLSTTLSAKKEPTIPTIYIDNKGVMRWSDNHREASFYGVNYTLPFAHGYRAINSVGKNHKEAIDKDVYHFARLGFNAYRIHIWDVEVSDAKGNLKENEHLDLLDYLIAKLRERNIHVLITTMTNFGNGYPERNEQTDGFSYLYDKCQVHNDPKAIAAQENYVAQLVNHVNPYTKAAYKDDPSIVGFEVNNEPCHSGQPQETENYINRMLDALKKAGNSKPVFYNVSHNMDHVQAYYNTAVQGTTYQWYPIGLVAGRTRKGNFLPFVDSYDIPFSSAKGFNKKAKAVYEFDPADITYSYMYPAMARTFRSTGFQWITQFAYDPMDIASTNTDYQTHYLNLAYTPSKAISMKIASEVAYTVSRNKKFGKYPTDTVFGKFSLGYSQDLSELNSGEKFFYSNSTNNAPVLLDMLSEIAGVGSSPVVSYEGTGAYFLDKLEGGLWRLEVMPDPVQVADPYGKPSFAREAVAIAWNAWKMGINLADLGENFSIQGINEKNIIKTNSTGNSFLVKPGVYLLQRTNVAPKKSWNGSSKWKNIELGEYAAPTASAKSFSVNHSSAKVVEANRDLKIRATIVGESFPDSVLIYSDKVSFWRDKNPSVKMVRTKGYTYEATILANELKSGNYRYNIVAFKSGKCQTFPGGVSGNPLDWDYTQSTYFETEVVESKSPLALFEVSDSYSSMDTYGIPEKSYLTGKLVRNGLNDVKRIEYTFHENDNASQFFWKKYIQDDIYTRPEALAASKTLCVTLQNPKGISSVKVGFVTSDGFTYTTNIHLNLNQNEYKIPLEKLAQDKTALLPAPYPVFLKRFFEPEISIPFDIRTIESIVLNTEHAIKDRSSIEIGSMWLE
jgi:hypothetical protein